MYVVTCVQGTLIQHLKEHILHGNMTSDDVIFYYSTVSENMSNHPGTFDSHLLSLLPSLSLPLSPSDWMDDVELVGVSSCCRCHCGVV